MDQGNPTSHSTRRQFVAAAAGVAALAAATPLMAADHSGHAGHGAHSSAGKNAKLMASALECIGKSEICMEHCITTLKEGDTKLAKCLETAKDAVAACHALVALSAGNSKHLKALAELCIAVCQDCADECKKHVKHHTTCKDCMDSCLECIKHCKKVA